MVQCRLKSIVWLVLVITCLRGWLGINYSSSFLKILKLPKQNESNIKFCKIHENDLSKKLPKISMWLLAIKPNQQNSCVQTTMF